MPLPPLIKEFSQTAHQREVPFSVEALTEYVSSFHQQLVFLGFGQVRHEYDTPANADVLFARTENADAPHFSLFFNRNNGSISFSVYYGGGLDDGRIASWKDRSRMTDAIVDFVRRHGGAAMNSRLKNGPVPTYDPKTHS